MSNGIISSLYHPATIFKQKIQKLLGYWFWFWGTFFFGQLIHKKFIRKCHQWGSKKPPLYIHKSFGNSVIALVTLAVVLVLTLALTLTVGHALLTIAVAVAVAVAVALPQDVALTVSPISRR